ncbi:hypothetical protein B0H11DRAFT_2357766 [Mycena galericulata]|nr:hypothetical protein B0H11DRAFT_2357766 [Mycena galericulata]
MYTDGRTNPTPSHFAKNNPVETHPPGSRRLLQQRQLDREGRAICRIVYTHGIGVERIARVFCVSDDTVIQALENKPGGEEYDKAENDYWYLIIIPTLMWALIATRYVSSEYRNEYPTLPNSSEAHAKKKSAKGPTSTASKVIVHSQTSVALTKIAKKPQPPSDSGSSSRSREDQEASDTIKNPTCRQFKHNILALQTSSKLRRSQTRVLDRTGRAICRIVHPYLNNYTKIAAVFGITHTRVRRAVLNQYTPPDDVLKDYEYAGQEFRDGYPPLPDEETRTSTTPSDTRQVSLEIDDISYRRANQPEIADGRVKKVTNNCHVPRSQVYVELPTRKRPDPRQFVGGKSHKRPRSPELDSASNKRAKEDPPAKQIAQEAPHIESPSTAPELDAIRRFLENIGGFDLSHWQDTLSKKGLRTMDDLSKLGASLDETRLVKTLTRLFADQQLPEVHILLLADALADLTKAGL